MNLYFTEETDSSIELLYSNNEADVCHVIKKSRLTLQEPA